MSMESRSTKPRRRKPPELFYTPIDKSSQVPRISHTTPRFGRTFDGPGLQRLDERPLLRTLHLESLSVFSEVLLNYGVEGSVEQPPENPADSSPHFLLSGFELKKIPRAGDGLLLPPW